MSSERLFSLTGLHSEDFNDLYNIIRDESYEFESSSINLKDALGLFLLKYRLGLSIKQACDIINICSYFQAKALIKRVREILRDRLVPTNLGFEHMKREEINQKHTTLLSKKLLNVGTATACPERE